MKTRGFFVGVLIFAPAEFRVLANPATLDRNDLAEQVSIVGEHFGVELGKRIDASLVNIQVDLSTVSDFLQRAINGEYFLGEQKREMNDRLLSLGMKQWGVRR